MLKEALYNKYIKPLKREEQDYVGIEFEFPIVNLEKEAVDFDVCHKLTEAFMKHFEMSDHLSDDEGFIYNAQNPKTLDSLSFDCSYNTLEFSFGVERDIHVLEQRFNAYYSFVQQFLHEHHHTLTGMGINPYRQYNHDVPIKNERYRMLFHYLHSYPKYHNRPYHAYPSFGLFSCASQVQLDVDENNVTDVLNVFSRLEPYKSVLFANSLFDGKLLSRDDLWQNSMHGFNLHNVGFYDHEFKDIDDLLTYFSHMSLYNVKREGRDINFEPIELNEYFKQEKIDGEYFDGDHYQSISFTPDINDLRYLRAYKLEDLTYRGTVEFRSCCEQPVSDAFTVAAFHAGLKKKYKELNELLDSFELYKKDSFVHLRERFNKGDYSIIDADELKSNLNDILALAKEGLKERGYHEEHYLDTLNERAAHLTNPAKELQQGLKNGQSIESFIEKYSEL